MKLQEALRKVIRQFGGSVIQEKRLMSFLADYNLNSANTTLFSVF